MEAIKFTQKQLEMFRKPIKTWNLCGGAVRSGKSFSTICGIPLKIKQHYNEPCLIVAKTLSTIERNVLRVLRSIYGNYDIGNIRSKADGGRYVVIYGKEVDCVGANDDRSVTKIQGSEYGYAYCDEMTAYPENFFNMLSSRLSIKGSCCDGTFNPESPSHYLKQFIDKEDFDGNYTHFSIYDNEYLDKEYVKRLENQYRGTIYFDRWILGDWVRTEGLVFPLFKREKHFITPQLYSQAHLNDWSKISYLIVGGDGATTNDATSLIPLAIFEDGSAAVLDIFYHNPKVNGQLANSDLVKYMAKWYTDIIDKYKLNDYSKRRNKVQIYTAVDCAAADLIVEMRKVLPSNYHITSMTHKDIQQTTDIVNNAFSLEMVHIFDFGGYFNYIRGAWEKTVNPLVTELETMIWEEDNLHYDDKVPNDAADAFRYAVATYYNNPDNLWKSPDLGF